jgi:curved DNA-binding protein CbpA
MQISHAIGILRITEKEISEELLKKAYRTASKKYHPDVNPAGEEMQKLINAAFETLSALPFPIKNQAEKEDAPAADYAEQTNEALNKIKNLVGLVIEICGAWVWVSGNTKEHKDALKAAGFMFSGPKKIWYFRPPEQKRRHYNGNTATIEEIRAKYGSQNVKPKSRPYLNA